MRAFVSLPKRPFLAGLAVIVGILALLVASGPLPARGEASADDTFFLSDDPGNWFQSELTGTPVTFVAPGARIDFKIDNCCTDTRHTVTLLVKPEGSSAELDQDQSKKGTLSVDLDLPGVYLFVCKVHPYMTVAVGVTDESGEVPPVSSAVLPFLSHMGLDELDATAVLDVVTTIAPDEASRLAKWDILGPDDPSLVRPPVPGVGEVWIDTQFELVPGQEKPGTLTVVDARTFLVEREVRGGLDPDAEGMWNNPHNLWADFAHGVIYNSNWFGRWINKIDRRTGDVIESLEVGEAPTHIITNPNPSSPEFGVLHVPLSADDDIVRIEDGADGLKEIGSSPTGEGRNHPHGHWLKCGLGEVTVVPNVFKGLGFEGSVSLLDTESGTILEEFLYDANDPIRSAFLMPLAVGECHVHLPDGGHMHKAYVGSVVSGMVTVIDIDSRTLLRNIPVTLTPGDEVTGLPLGDTLQVPIQMPVSPDGRWAAAAVLSLTTVERTTTGAADHVALIDTMTDEVVAWIGTPAGTHGVNWGFKRGGGYYAWVTNQHANVVTVIDPDPDGDGDGTDAAVVGQILLANGSPGAGATDGTGRPGGETPSHGPRWLDSTHRPTDAPRAWSIRRCAAGSDS